MQPIRTHFANCRQKRDHRRRQTVKNVGATRLHLTALAHNTILPPEMRETAKREIRDLPRDSNVARLNLYCAVAGRGRGVVSRYRLCRFVFRQLADHNQLAGVQRAMWSYSSPYGGRHEGKYEVPISTGYQKYVKSKYTY